MGMSYFICPFVEKKKKLFFSLQLIDLALFKKKKKNKANWPYTYGFMFGPSVLFCWSLSRSFVSTTLS